MSSRGIHDIQLRKLEFMACMPEMKDKSDTWRKLLKIAMCHLWETNSLSLLPRDVFFPLFFFIFFGGGGTYMHFPEILHSFGKYSATL